MVKPEQSCGLKGSRIESYIEHGLLEAARVLAESALQEPHCDTGIIYQYIKILSLQRQHHTLIKVYKRLQDPAQILAPPLAIDLFAAHAYFETNDTEMAMLLVTKTLSRLHEPDAARSPQTPDQEAGETLLVKCYHLASQISKALGKIKESNDHLARARAIDPHFFLPTLNKHQESLFHVERYFEYLQAINSTPQALIEPSPDQLAVAYLHLQLHPDMLHVLADTKKAAPDSSQFFFIQALYKQMKGRDEDSRKDLHEAASKDRFYTPAWLALGHSYAAIGDHEQAISCYSHILRHIDEIEPYALAAIVAEYFRVNKPVLASPYLHTLMSVSNKDPYALNELGVLYYTRGELGNALDVFQKAIDLFSSGSLIYTSTRHNQFRKNKLATQIKLATTTKNSSLLASSLREIVLLPEPAPIYLELYSTFFNDPGYMSRCLDSLLKLSDSHRHRKYLSYILEKREIQ